jgi:methionyl-tRNA formyltransferase
MGIVFMGTPDFAVPSLMKLIEEGHRIEAVVTQPDRPRGRGRRSLPSPVKQAALDYGLPLLQPEKIRDPDSVAALEALAPELIVTAAYGQILPQHILDLPEKGCINVHASLLPAYRGAAPIHWALIRGEKETGITIMKMDAGMDTGDIILQESIFITPRDNVGTLHKKLAQLGSELLVQAVELIRLDEHAGIPQDHSQASYAPLLKKEHERIDWLQTAEQLVNHFRGMNPWPGAYTDAPAGLLKIYEGEVYTGEGDGVIAREDLPGTVVRIMHGKGFVVAAGKGHVLIRQVKPQNGKAMTADEYVRGYRVEEGDRLQVQPAE